MPPPDAEANRLAALRRYRVLDTEPEEAFDRIVHLAQALFDMPVALISLLDDRRQWFKARWASRFRKRRDPGSSATRRLSTPEEKSIGGREQNYITDDGSQAPRSARCRRLLCLSL